MGKYNFIPAAQAYFEIRDELEAFSKLKKHAFAIFNTGFDVNQLGLRLKSWHALCEWNHNDVKRSCNMADINFHIVTLIFEDFAHGRIKKKQFCNELDSVRNLIINHEVALSSLKDEAYEKLIFQYNRCAEASKNLGFIFKEPQVIDWVMELLQS